MNPVRTFDSLSIIVFARIGIGVYAPTLVACASSPASDSPTVLRSVRDAGAIEPLDGSPAGPEATDATASTDSATASVEAEGAADSGPESSPAVDDTATGPQVCGFSPCAPGAPCADLTVDRDDLLASILVDTRTFLPTDCAVVEGCILTTGLRRLLHFDTGTQNVGTADVVVGDPTANACFQWSACHQHYHFKGVGKYTLYQTDGTTVAAVGHKQGFCLEDVEPIPSLTPPPATPANPFTCQNQGLSVGWEDIYPNDIDCQWIDITGVAAGSYILSVVINSEEYLPESNYDNNEARVPVTILPP